jgi:protease PrsW
MQQVLLTMPVVLPAIFWAAYHYHKDRHLPEPASHLFLAFGLGLLAVGLSKLLYLGLAPLGLRYDALALAESNPLGLLAYAVLAIGPIEELTKLLPFVAIIIHLKEFDEPVDGIIYASFIGLGYAAAENVLYLDYLTPWEAAARGFASPVVHIVFASIWAYAFTTAWLARRPVARSLLLGFLVAAVLHGIYDFLVLQSPVAALPIAAALILAIWIWRLVVFRRLQRLAARQTEEPQPRL